MTGKQPGKRAGIKPSEQLRLPFKGKVSVRIPEPDFPVGDKQLMERVVERDNLRYAFRKVMRNGGSPGIDGMTVKELAEYLKQEWPAIRRQLLNGEYIPKPVRRVEIPKPGGGIRKLGIPTVLDRFIQQALLQVLQREWDPTFSEFSYGFRPGKSAHQALSQAQSYLKKGFIWVVDMDLEKFFDRVNHDKLMSEVEKRVEDRRVIKLILRFLRSGVKYQDKLYETEEGAPQGGPLSPLLANLILDLLDRELERRGHRFVRYADDCNIYLRSKRSGLRVMSSITQYLGRRLKLKVNRTKSAVGLTWERQFLGFTFSTRLNRRISDKSIKRFKNRVREITRRTRGRRIEKIVEDLRRFMQGWQAYFNFTQVRYILRELDSWVKRRLRCYLWKQWGRRGYRELVKLGVSRDLAWNTAKSAHGPWRLSRSPGLAFALTAKYFADLGLPQLYVKLA